MKAPSLTLGIEEEYQIIDPETRELRSYITEILDHDHVKLGEVKPELHQSMVEIGSKVCHTPAELKAELVRLRGLVIGLAAKSNLRVVAAGTHPFSSWLEQEITPLEREPYPSLVDGRVVIAERMVDTAPYVAMGEFVDGCLTRLSTAALLNVTAGGGSQVPTFVVERR